MSSSNPTAEPDLVTFDNIKDAVIYLRQNGVQTSVRIGGDYKSAKRIKQYFYRQGCNVTVKDEPEGTRLVTYNSPSLNGREVRRGQKRRYGKSQRQEEEATISELLAARSNHIEIGESFFAKGRDNKISSLLRRRFSSWRFQMNKHEDGWKITRVQ